jgi:hypothetical protein
MKQQLSARVSDNVADDLEEFAEKNNISKSEATNRLLNDALKMKNGEAEILVPDGAGTKSENQLDVIEQKVVSKYNQSIINIIGLFYIGAVLRYDVSSAVTILGGLAILSLVVYVHLDDWIDYLSDRL